MSSYIVKNTNDNGIGSLRQGIIFANNNTNTPTTITFDISANGEIKLESCLPKIKATTIINGNLDSNGKPLNIINGKHKYEIFQLYNTINCEITNLCLIGSSGAGIFINESYYNTILNCWIGINTNNEEKSNENGIVIYKSEYNKVGSNPDLNQEYFSNVISGNKKNGILIEKSRYNDIKNNIIGLSYDCISKIPNYTGISLEYSKFNIIGGKELGVDASGNINNPTGDKGTIPPVFIRPVDGNIISGNNNDGMLFEHSHNNQIIGNYIGTDNTGNVSLGNGTNGINLQKSNFNQLYGCGVDTNPFIYYNVIGGNKEEGLLIHNSNFTTIQGNFIGIAANNTDPVPNKKNGVKISGTSESTVFGGIIPLGNVISGNGENGIYATDKSNGVNSINTFCGIQAFGEALPNGANGILIDGETSNVKLNTNVISGNELNGILITGKANTGIITNNINGLNTGGNKSVPNKANGLQISGSASNIIVGLNIPSVIENQVMSGNLGHGIEISENASRIVISNCCIGLAIDKISPITNGLGGVLIKDKVHDCEFGDDLNFLYIYDESNYAIKLKKCTYNNIITYCQINTNKIQEPLPHNQNIINLSDKNFVYANGLPILP